MLQLTTSRSEVCYSNGLHWMLGVTFREDDSRVRDRVAARNLATPRKVALYHIGRDKAPRISIRARREQAVCNEQYMLALLASTIHA